MKTSKQLTMSDTDKSTLERIARNGNTPQKLALRARIAMMSAAGLPTSQIMQELGTSTPTITRWRTRYEGAGVAGLLRDRTRPGRKKRIDEAKVREVVERTLNEKPQGATQ
jgi:transposase